jgi:hypothetical protein
MGCGRTAAPHAAHPAVNLNCTSRGLTSFSPQKPYFLPFSSFLRAMDQIAAKGEKHTNHQHFSTRAAVQRRCQAGSFLNEEFSLLMGNVFNRHWLCLKGWRIYFHQR